MENKHIMLSIKDVKMDDHISNKIIGSTNIFRNIHPNIITLFGMYINLIIYNVFVVDNMDFITYRGVVGILFIIRWLCDCLDGNVARKYKKTSYIGSLLDTASDFMLIGIFLYYIFAQMLWNYLLGIILYLFMIDLSVTRYKILHDHQVIKMGTGNCDIMVSFIANNSYIPFILYYFFIIYVN